MNKLVHAIGCCLLFAAPAGCVQQAATPAATTQGVDSATMDESNQRVAEVAAQANGWKVADVVVTNIADGSAGDCRLVGAYSSEVLSSTTKTYAVLRSGDVVGRGDADALVRVLDACGPDAPATLWAEAIVAFDDRHPPGRVKRAETDISSVAHEGALENGGYTFHPPRFAADGTVEFFMTDVEGNRLFVVRGSRDGGGPVEVSVEPAGKR